MLDSDPTSEAPRCRGFGGVHDAHLAAVRAAADISGVVLPIVGARTDSDGKVSLFVAVSYAVATHIASFDALQTEVRCRGYSLALFSIPALLQPHGDLGYLVASRPITLLGDEYQPKLADFAVALAINVLTVGRSGARQRLVGPDRCARCHHAIPPERVQMFGAHALCVRCQTCKEKIQ